MCKTLRFLFILFLLIFNSPNIFAQNNLFTADFSTPDLDSWTFYGFSTGLHGAVDTPMVVEGKCQIKTRDQQKAYIVAGNSAWQNYNLEFDVKIEQSLDDASNGIQLYFNVDSVLLTPTKDFYFSGYVLNIKGRDGSWYARREYVDGTPADGMVSGFRSIAPGIEYHIKIVESSSVYKIYFNEIGYSQLLLTELPKSVNHNSGGRIAIGGNDDLISIDNVFVTANVTGIANSTPPIPKDFVLYQNFPNPFNPTTHIAFTIPGNGQVSLSIFTADGEFVKTILDQKMQAGYHETIFDGSELGSGFYFLKLRSGTLRQNRKMLLLK